MSILQFLAAANGIAQLWSSADRQFLGLLSSDRHDTNSISNLDGIYGSLHSTHSIRNLHGLYGGLHGGQSPYNPYCSNPPVISYQNQIVLVITRNTNIQTNGLPIIDPDFLLGVYMQLGYSPNMFYPTSTPMDRLNQAAWNSQQSLNQSAGIIASMFR
ncbi:MAG: hypothetical protein RMY16_26465 [Nostoc sp. DedQUE12b]|uniref:hypothetical protein n=1 Tax=Nostoc sp. DedQUE12b TaxID=3075398 RepID=UPI002AD51016|nr:hypothetical protein [Nostoc sp. DedQUE12b]MDZ8089065.1 hypothetical protein [Nostoc sp. DedQUE12b]